MCTQIHTIPAYSNLKDTVLIRNLAGTAFRNGHADQTRVSPTKRILPKSEPTSLMVYIGNRYRVPTSMHKLNRAQTPRHKQSVYLRCSSSQLPQPKMVHLGGVEEELSVDGSHG
jgi:hypothetical protein